MAHYKRKKPRRDVKCVLCTSGRSGNSLSKQRGRGGRANDRRFWPTVKEQETA